MNDYLSTSSTSTEGLQIEGSDGNDRINGSDGNDIINSGDGDDTINSGAGDDTINGGRGLDILDGGAGTDVLALFDLNRGDENIGFVGEADNFTFFVDGADEGTFLNIESVKFDNGEVVSTQELDFTNAIASEGLQIEGSDGNDRINGSDGSDITMLPELPSGSNELLRIPLEFPDDVELDDIEVFVSDFVVPPNEADARHYHKGQDFLYVVEGSGEFKVDGEPDEIIEAGDAREVPYERRHSARATQEGARVIGFSVHEEGEPERFLVEDREHEDDPAGENHENELVGEEHDHGDHKDHEHGGDSGGADFAIDLTDSADQTSDITMLPDLPPGRNEILRVPLEFPNDVELDDIEVFVTDFVLSPNELDAAHYHPGQNFLYVLEGSVEFKVDGEPDEIVEAGGVKDIPYERKHSARATEEGARVVGFSVHEEDRPERFSVEDHEHGDEVEHHHEEHEYRNYEHEDEVAGGDFATINLTDSADQTVEFTVSRDAGFDNTVGFYEVNADGSVQDPISGQTIAIGKEGYQDAALANSLDFTLSTGNEETSTFTTDLTGGKQYGTFIIADSGLDELLDEDSSNDPPIYFDTPEANASGFDYIRTSGSNTFEYEDLTYGANGVSNDGTPDYNDMVVEYSFV